MVHTTRVHMPYSQVVSTNTGQMTPVFTGRVDHTADQHGPWTGSHFWTPVFMGRVYGLQPRPVNTDVILDTRVHGPWTHGPWTRPVNTVSVYWALLTDWLTYLTYLLTYLLIYWDRQLTVIVTIYFYAIYRFIYTSLFIGLYYIGFWTSQYQVITGMSSTGIARTKQFCTNTTNARC